MKTVDDFLIAVDEWREAKAEVKRCYREADMSAGYHCYRYAERERKAREACAEILESVIDERIRLATQTDPSTT